MFKILTKIILMFIFINLQNFSTLRLKIKKDTNFAKQVIQSIKFQFKYNHDGEFRKIRIDIICYNNTVIGNYNIGNEKIVIIIMAKYHYFPDFRIFVYSNIQTQ